MRFKHTLKFCSFGAHVLALAPINSVGGKGTFWTFTKPEKYV